jgi:hypothetical protein
MQLSGLVIGATTMTSHCNRTVAVIRAELVHLWTVTSA